MIEHIFSFLPYDDRLQATAVCRRWKAIFEARVINETLLTVANIHRDGVELSSFHCGIRKMINSTRIYRDLKFVDIDFSNIESNVDRQLSIMIANLGLNVLNFTMQGCRLSYAKLYMVIRLLRRLKTVCIDDCRIYHDLIPVPEFKPRATQLQKVSIFNINSEDEWSITNLLMNGNSASIAIKAEKCRLKSVEDLVEIYADRIKHLTLSFSETRTTRRIFECSTLTLESLCLIRNPNLDMHHISFQETIATQTMLRELNINMPISLRTLADISRNFTVLEYLQVRINEKETIEAMPFIWPKLKVRH